MLLDNGPYRRCTTIMIDNERIDGGSAQTEYVNLINRESDWHDESRPVEEA